LNRGDLFLPAMAQEKSDFLNLLGLTAKLHGKTPARSSSEVPPWGETFYHLDKSSFWQKLGDVEKNIILKKLSSQILQEAFFIESAGMAYAAKMNLLARTKEERQFYCFVAEEEAKHLMMIEELSEFDQSPDAVPSFAELIGKIIDDTSFPSSLLLIQILLEGWGLNYYKSLDKESSSEAVSRVFKAIIKDEIRHHSAGVVLFSSYHTLQEIVVKEFHSYLISLLEMVRIGPLRVTKAVFDGKHIEHEMIKTFLSETGAIVETKEKLEFIRGIFMKSLDKDIDQLLFSEFKFQSLSLEEMSSEQMRLIS
jgi:rubrerythrin